MTTIGGAVQSANTPLLRNTMLAENTLSVQNIKIGASVLHGIALNKARAALDGKEN
jgi:hypothetical protein